MAWAGIRFLISSTRRLNTLSTFSLSLQWGPCALSDIPKAVQLKAQRWPTWHWSP